MKTSAQWWAETKADNEKLMSWLKRQYIGELGAYRRISELADLAPEGNRAAVFTIASQENKHAALIRELLVNRGHTPPEVAPKGEDRYWAEILGKLPTFEHITAAGALAEDMRLKRIEAIANDVLAPYDIVTAFKTIFSDEKWHAKAFMGMTNLHALREVIPLHEAGLIALELEA